MTFYSVVNPPAMVNGQPEDISVVLANFQAVQSVINALTDDNIAPNAGIKLTKLESTSGTFGGVTFIGGNIEAPGYVHTGGDVVAWSNNLPVGMGHLGPALQPGFRLQDDTYLYRTAAGELTTNILRATNLQERSEKAQPGGYASLDGSGKVPVAQIPDQSATYQVRSEKAAPNGYASLDGSGLVPVAQIPNLASTYQVLTEKAQANGYASLGSDGKVPTAQLPAPLDLSPYQLRSEEGVPFGYASLDATGRVPLTQLPVADMGVINDPLWNAKGDLAVATGPDLAAILPVGTNAQVLTVDTAQSTGLRWADPAAGGGSGGHVIQDESVSMPARANLDFQGAGVSLADNAAFGRTEVVIPADGHTIYDEASALPYQTRLAFAGAGVAATNDSGGGRTLVTIPGGIDWSDVGTGTTGPTPISYATALPASPINGQEAILVDSTTNPTYQWRFRYNALSSSPYKWEFIGGSPFRSFVSTSEAAGSLSTWVELATVQRFQAVQGGEYHVRYGCHFSRTTGSASEMQMGVAVATPTVAAADAYKNDAVAYFGNMVAEQTETIAALAVLKLQFRAFVANAGNTFEQRYMTITPIRVA